MDKVGIHVSDMNTFKSCRRQWDFTSLLRQGMEPKRPYKPFVMGRAVHWCLQQYYDLGHALAPESFLDEYLIVERRNNPEIVEYSDVMESIELVRGMLEGYGKYQSTQQGTFSDGNLTYIALETSFKIPMINPNTGRRSPRAVLEGRFDGLVRRKDDNSVWVIEHKTAADIGRLVNTLFNVEQAGVYSIAAEYLFKEPISGVIYNIMAKKVPTKPRLLKSGTLSLDKGINTTFATYMSAIYEAHGENVDEEFVRMNYGAHLRWLYSENRDAKFFLRVPVVRSPKSLDNTRRRIWAVTHEMLSPKTVCYASASWYTCTFCQFKLPCLSLENGNDIGPIMEAEYRPRRIWDDEEGEENSTTTESNGGNDATGEYFIR